MVTSARKRSLIKKSLGGVIYDKKVQNRLIAFELAIALCLIAVAIFPHVRHSLVLATTHQPERLTELYFPTTQPLPATYRPGETLSVGFVVHNLEYRNMVYPFQVSLVTGGATDKLYSGNVSVKNGRTSVVTVPVVMPSAGTRTALTVSLTNLHQSVHYWLQEAH